MENKSDISLEQDLAKYARVLGHPARIAILLSIAEKGYEVRGEIVSVPDMAAATVIQHLRELKKAGLIHGRIFGLKAHYWLDRDQLEKVRSLFEELSVRLKAFSNS